MSYQDGNYIMSGGAIQGIKEGDTFTVYRRGQTVTNPQTNVPIELPGKSIGKLKVQSVIAGDVNSELSICGKVSGELPASGFGDYYVQEN